jgi:hypothetical protein
MDRVLILKKYMGEGIEDALFPNTDNPIEIGAFRYDAKRMGGAPTITASVYYPSCLDGVWTDNVYAKFNGEKYYLKQTPTSSYNNESTMYKHDLELISERVALDNVYFFDVVTGNPMDSDKPVSNSTKVVFFGDVREFAERLKASLEYSSLDYTVVVDDGVVSEEKLMSFENQFFSNVLQEIYNIFEVPYYFEGKVIHIGKSSPNNEVQTFSYGVDDALLSITKNNANYKIVNRATAIGSSDNIPFYYPNNSPKGVIKAEPSRSGLSVTMINAETYANSVGLNESITYESLSLLEASMSTNGEEYSSGTTLSLDKIVGSTNKSFELSFYASGSGIFYLDLDYVISNVRNPIKGSNLDANTISCRFTVNLFQVRGEQKMIAKSTTGGRIEIPISYAGNYVVRITMEFASIRDKDTLSCDYALNFAFSDGFTRWNYKGKEIDPKDIGLSVNGAITGDFITQRLVEYINTSQYLLPSKYRETKGKERFYNATNETYDGWIFNNPYVEGKPKEHIFTVGDIKPSIEGMTYGGQRIDMFEAFAYDENDNDETYEDEKGNVYFKHPYFFAKLKPLGFNLFEHAIEQQPMTISFTSGGCGGCNFEIAVDEVTQKNTVQVDANGNLIYENGRVLCGAEGSGQGDVQPQPEQQDTTNRSVWIALRKEEDTYGILMPKAPIGGVGGHRPSTNDIFVILGINLPYEYIDAAEKKVEAEIIKYLKENNDEKFTFSIGFSRIYFTENEGVLDSLNENSKINIVYDNKPYELYVSSFSYTMSEGEPLPEIKVELDETLKVSQNAFQNAINEIKSSLGNSMDAMAEAVVQQRRSYVSKVEDDTASGIVDFSKGIKFGEGGKVEVLDNNSAKLTIDYLEVTKKASFTSLEIQEKTHVGGQMLVTPAAINCGEVEEFDDFYRCYFQTKGEDGDEIFNQFAIGDQAICQTFNAWGSKYYWRLVVGIGEDYIDLSKTECDEGSGVPQASDKIIQLGNQLDEARQNAIVIAAYGDGSPYIIQYKGINNFEIPDNKIVTKLSSTENIFTGKVHMELGSDGLENIEGGLKVGGSNMLRNSGFTGDYLSAQLADQIVLDAVDEMFNPPLVHWDDEENPAVGAVVQDSEVSESGKEVVLTDGHITQKLYQKVIVGETYVVSFKAKGKFLSEETNEETGELVKKYTSLNITFGGVDIEIALTDEWAYYTKKVVAKETSNIFTIESTNATICELQLERGSIATAWGRSFLDNSSDRAYYQARKYLDEALKGFTDVYGGLILTGLIKVGTQANGVMTKETAGINGQYDNDNDVAFWAGGTDTQAINAIKQTGGDEANFAVSHGGKVVMNDAFVRGKIEATSGIFRGFVKSSITEINATNEEKYITTSSLYPQPYIDVQKAGGYLKVTGPLSYIIGFWGTRFLSSLSQVEEVRSMVGAKCIVVNQSGQALYISGDTKTDSGYQSLIMDDDSVAYLECRVGVDGSGQEEIYWHISAMQIKTNFSYV